MSKNLIATETQTIISHDKSAGDAELQPESDVERLIEDLTPTPCASVVVPEILRSRYVETGYRFHLGTKETVFSCCRLHNETVNIWTAFIPAMIYVIVALATMAWPKISFADRAIFIIFLLGALISFGASTIFHWFGLSMSLKLYAILLRLDYAGIGCLIGTSFFPPLYYGFYCQKAERLTYLIIVSLLSITCGVLIVGTPHRLQKKLTVVRSLVFSALAGFGIVPIIHMVAIKDFSQISNLLPVLLIFVSWAIYGIGVIIYIIRVPERFWPGKFDIWFHSHQWWHLMIFLGSFTHCINCILSIYFFYRFPPPCSNKFI